MANSTSQREESQDNADCQIINIKSDPDVVEIRDDSGNDDDICELEHLRKLFIGGLSLQTTEQSLKAFYSQWGKVVDVVVMRDAQTKRSRGFGFITYTKSSSVNAAQDNRPHEIDGKTVEAKRALPRPERENRESNISVKKLFVGGLKDNHDEDCLREYFSQFGNVISIKILTDRVTSKRRGFAFIEFDDYDAVDKAILQKQHSIKYVIVDVKKSVYKQEKQNQQPNGQSAGANEGYSNQKRNNLKAPPPVPVQQHPGYQMPPPPQHGMYQQPPPPPMNGCPTGPPPNYNYWGPPPPMQSYPNTYQQPPPVPPMNNGWNGWNGGPPPPATWQQPAPHWGYPPAGPPPPAPAANWNAQVPPPGTPGSVPPPQQAPPPQPAAAAPPAPQHFGTGYQQNYGGGPVKHNGAAANRMNPYSAPPSAYANGQPVPPAPYGGYVAAPAQPKPGPSAAPVPAVGKYRR